MFCGGYFLIGSILLGFRSSLAYAYWTLGIKGESWNYVTRLDIPLILIFFVMIVLVIYEDSRPNLKQAIILVIAGIIIAFITGFITLVIYSLVLGMLTG